MKNPINFFKGKKVKREKGKKGLTPLEGKNEKGKGKNPINFLKVKKLKGKKVKKGLKPLLFIREKKREKYYSLAN